MFGFEPYKEEKQTSPNYSSDVKTHSSVSTEVSLVKVSGTTTSHLESSLAGYNSFSERRLRLPIDPKTPKPALSVWSFLKSAIGKDLSKVTLPVLFNEPLSMLQRMCEGIKKSICNDFFTSIYL